MIVNRSELAAELTAALAVTERKTTIPVLSHVLLESAEEGLRISATDLDTALVVDIEAQPGADIGSLRLCAPAKELLNAVRAASGKDIVLTGQGDRLTIQEEGGGARFELLTREADDFPSLEKMREDHDEEQSDSAELHLATLQDGIARVIYAVSKEDSRFQLGAGMLELAETGDGFTLVATDGHRLALAEHSGEGGAGSADRGMLVSRKALTQIKALDVDDDRRVRIEKGGHFISFRSGHRTLLARIPEGNFPDYRRLLKGQKMSQEAIFLRRDLEAAVRKAATLIGQRTAAVALEIQENRAVVTCANPDLGTTEAVAEGECQGHPVKVGVNPAYILDALGPMTAERVRLAYEDDGSPLRLSGVDADGYTVIVMPMKI